MTWLVVGANGQLGRSVCEDLARRRLPFVGSNSSELDLTQPLRVKQYVDAIKPTVILNAAAYTNVDQAESNRVLAWAVNAEGAGLLAEISRDSGAIFVYVSTDYVFSGISTTPYSEFDLPAPGGVYGETKAAGEQFVQEAYPAGTYIFRTAWLYSAMGKNFAKTMVRLALKDSSDVSVVNDQIGQPTFAGDLAKQMIDSVLKEIPFGIYHGTNSGEASWFEFAQEIFRLVGADVSRVKAVSSDAFSRPAKRPAYSVLGHDKWIGSGVEEMRDWKMALTESIPAIVSAVKTEG